MSTAAKVMDVRDPAADLGRLRIRLGIAMALAVVCFGLLAARFYYLQVVRFNDFHAQAEDNRITMIPVPPQRGQITDRNGIVLAENVFSYALEIAPARIDDINALIDELAMVVDISQTDRRRFRRLMAEMKFTDTVPLKSRLTDEEVAKIAAMRFRFPGVEVKARPYRNYPLGQTAAHVIGHIGRISTEDNERLSDAGKASSYAGTTHIGKLGVELSYEDDLRGEAGIEEVEVTAGGRAIRALSRKPAKSGKNLVMSLDIRLQKLVETWYGNRRGAMVAIEPESGDVLAFVSMPTFDPNLFVDGIDVQNWQDLNTNPDRPLLNRPLRGTYPPGSTYKPFMALAVSKSGIRKPKENIFDPGYFALGKHRFRDSKPAGHGLVDLYRSIVVSSDTYYYGAAYEMGVDFIHDFMKPWGFGQLTGIDLRDEATGLLPSTKWKKRRYKQPWYPGETPSIGIGQGYNNFTILQLAHATATLANDALVMRPHVVKSVEDATTGKVRHTVAKEVGRIDIPREALQLVKNAMVAVNREGTGRTPFRGAEYVSAGKTGTAQVVGIKQNEKYDASKVSERFRDHSLFVAFAPADKPKIALALIVENGGFGAQAAAPIARQVFDYYLLGKLPKDQNLPFPDRQDDEELRDVPESMEPELAPAEAASGTGPAAMAPAPVLVPPRPSPGAAGAPRPAPAPTAPRPAPIGPTLRPAPAATAPGAAPAGITPRPAPASTAPRPAPAATPAPPATPGITPATPAVRPGGVAGAPLRQGDAAAPPPAAASQGTQPPSAAAPPRPAPGAQAPGPGPVLNTPRPAPTVEPLRPAPIIPRTAPAAGPAPAAPAPAAP
ncbi:MAG TPA: penicillin-binding protein 2 [Lautropia sp.]|nr:penicillin-binding protein 2 [Lautropia sp.]